MKTSDPVANQHRLAVVEFVVLLAMMMAMTAFSIDAMLPALPEIAAELTPQAPNRAQMVITSFVLGMGLGTFLAGPLSDRFGRRAVIVGGGVLYAAGALLSWAAPTLEWVLAARIVQGIGVSGPRIAGVALVRDLYSGRQMARLLSFAMMVFALVPAAAPLIGSFIIAGFGWRGVFLAFVLFAALTMTWLLLRQPETLPKAARRSLNLAHIMSAAREVLGHRTVVLVILTLTLSFASLFSTLSTTQQVFDLYFQRGAEFPYWFAVVALVAGTASLVNARLVVRVGMRKMALATFAVETVLTALVVGLFLGGVLSGPGAFPIYLVWVISVFYMAGLTIGNLNAIAMEPLGHIAGMAASLVTAMATILSVFCAGIIGYFFDATPIPLMLGVFVCTFLGFLILRQASEDR